ncbi:MAG: DNA primase DnaG [Candidatus Micrarchaeota archaeon]|nr:DNA primase DnaG [Candidatus Micrarchaeota archaeon]
MGKTYIDTVKYMVKANFEVDGIIEKPDIVGALFGQTEGLLGDDLDFRELQKNGRLGRIEVDTQVKGGKTFGQIYVPSSLDMVETSILAASLEIVDRVGPCEARITVEKIEDSRSVKRKQLLDRARSLLKNLVVEELPESKQLTELVRDELKVAEVSTYGEDKLSCGPMLTQSESIVVVEGRADVINLLKNGIKNVVAVGGANVGKSIAKICNEKEVTVFLDGDRGGDIILKELMAVADIDYVARAPAGKEVEELARKEIIQCLRKRIPGEQAVNGQKRGGGQVDERQSDRFPQRSQRPPVEMQRQQPMQRQAMQLPSRPMMAEQPTVNTPSRMPMRQQEQFQAAPALQPRVVVSDSPPALLSALKELEGSLKARLLGSSFEVIAEVPIRDIMKALTDTEGVKAVVLDGIVTQRLVDLCEQKKAEYLVGVRAGTIMRKPSGTKIIVAE